MRKALYDDSFFRDGFSVVKNAVPASFLEQLKAAVQRVQDSVATFPQHLLERLTLERDLPSDRREGIEASAVGDAIFIIGDPVAFDKIFYELLRQPAIVSTIQEGLNSYEVAAHFMNVTIKQACFGRSIAWHRDYPNAYACPDGSRFIRIMLCLDGMSESGGATEFIPGSHLLDDAEVAGNRRQAGWEPTKGEAVKLCCDPGDLIVIHPKVLHGGGMNTSLTTRRNIVLQAGDATVPLRSAPASETVVGHRLHGS